MKYHHLPAQQSTSVPDRGLKPTIVLTDVVVSTDVPVVSLPFLYPMQRRWGAEHARGVIETKTSTKWKAKPP
jgi:hypothetical protein